MPGKKQAPKKEEKATPATTSVSSSSGGVQQARNMLQSYRIISMFIAGSSKRGPSSSQETRRQKGKRKSQKIRINYGHDRAGDGEVKNITQQS